MNLKPEIVSQLLTLLGFIGSLVIWGMTMERRVAQNTAKTESAVRVEQMRFEETCRRLDAQQRDITLLEQQLNECWLKQP